MPALGAARFVAGFFLAVLLCGLGRTQEVIAYSATSGVPLTTTGWTASLDGVQRFDPALGELTQVQLSYSGVVSQTVFAQNFSAQSPASYDLTDQVFLTVGLLGVPVLSISSPVAESVAGVLPASGSVSPGQTTPVDFSRAYTDSTLLAALSGAGSVNLVANAFESGSNYAIGGTGLGGGYSSASLSSLSVQYTYVPIPEPATVGAILGLASFALTLRRRFLASKGPVVSGETAMLSAARLPTSDTAIL